MISNETKALIIQKLFNFKNQYRYVAYRQSGNSSQVDNLFCLRKRNPENIIKIKKILRTKWSGYVSNLDLAESLNATQINGLCYFIGFDDVKNTVKFKEDAGGGCYYELHIPLARVLAQINNQEKKYEQISM